MLIRRSSPRTDPAFLKNYTINLPETQEKYDRTLPGSMPVSFQNLPAFLNNRKTAERFFTVTAAPADTLSLNAT